MTNGFGAAASIRSSVQEQFMKTRTGEGSSRGYGICHSFELSFQSKWRSIWLQMHWYKLVLMLRFGIVRP